MSGRRNVMVAAMSVLFAAGCCDMDDDDEGAGAGGDNAQGGGADGGSTADGGAGGEGGSGEGGTPASAEPTHSGIVSIQDMSIHGVPQAGHGLTVQILMNASIAPAYEDAASGCRAWVYDVETAPPPSLTDHGEVTITGIDDGSVRCTFEGGSYRCVAWNAEGTATVTPIGNGLAGYVLDGRIFGSGDVGRYLHVAGSGSANDGAFPIVGTNAGGAVVFNPQATSATFEATAAALVGAGPIPSNPNEVFAGPVGIGITPGGQGAFDFADVGPITPGGAFTIDDATNAVLSAIPLDGSAITLGCAGPGGSCDAAQATVVRISATDGDVEGLSPFAMPPPAKKQVEIQCALFDADEVTVPAEAMALLAEAHDASPMTRIRAAFMREGVAITQSSPPLPPNPMFVLVGHGMLGFTNP